MGLYVAVPHLNPVGALIWNRALGDHALQLRPGPLRKSIATVDDINPALP